MEGVAADLAPGASTVNAPHMGEEFGGSVIIQRLYIDGKQDVETKRRKDRAAEGID